MTVEPNDPGARAHDAASARKKSAAGQGLGFLVSGCMAFATDALLLEGLIRFAGMHALTARLFTIPIAMVVGWLCHRVMTFAVDATPSVREFFRYVLSASSAAAGNYSVYAALIMLTSISPFAALIISSIVAAICSYFSMRYFVFRTLPIDARRPRTKR